jgi:hypothetical protein
MSFRRSQLFLLSCSALATSGAGDRIRSCNSGECQAGEEESGAILLQRRGQLLRNEEELLFNTTDMRKLVPAIGFLKTHKTGSSTFATILLHFAQAHGMNIGFPQDDQYWGWPGSFPGQENEQQSPPTYDLIANHAVFNSARWREYLASNPVFVSSVREPSSQAVSAYDFYRVQDRLDNTFAKHLEWVEALQSASHKPFDISKSTARFLNPQAWDFGWYEYVGLTTEYDRNAKMIKRWLTDLDNDFTNVVILEHFDEGVALLARTLNVEPREFAYVQEKTAPLDEKTVPSETEYSKLLKLYPVDRALYRHFKHVFQKRWANVPDSARTYDLAKLRNASGTLQAQCEHIETCPGAWILSTYAYTCYLHNGFQNEFLTQIEYSYYQQYAKLQNNITEPRRD